MKRRRKASVKESLVALLCGLSFLAVLAGLVFCIGLVIRVCLAGSAWGLFIAGLLLASVVVAVVRRKMADARSYRELKARGVDYGLRDESLQAVDGFLAQFGKPSRRKLSDKVVVAPLVRELAERYSSVRYKKTTLFKNNCLCNGISFKKDPQWYVEIAHPDDESYYLVRQSSADETVYYAEIEWMPAPVPYASDIRHYLAMCWQKLQDEATAKGNRKLV